VRGDAAWRLGLTGAEAKAAVPALLEALHDDVAYVRGDAAWAPGNIGSCDYEGVAPALILLLEDEDSVVRRYAVEALGKIGQAEEAVPVLISALEDENADVRSAAVTSLAIAGQQEVIPVLIRVLEDKSEGGRVSKTIDAVVAGHICLDVIPDLAGTPQDGFEQRLRPGRLVEVGPAAIATGGAVSNTGLALHKLGISTRLMGKVGDDPLGQVVRQVVAAHGGNLVDGMVIDETASTSYTIIIDPPGVDRAFLHFPGANDTFGAGDVRYDVVAKARLFHFGYPPLLKLIFQDGGAQLVEIFRRVKGLGVTTSLDMTLPDPASVAGRADWAAILRAVMPSVDVFLPSIEETLYMLRRETYEALSQEAGGFLEGVTPALLSELSGELLAMGGKIVGFKLGERGMYVRTADRAAVEVLGAARPTDASAWADRELWAPCFRVDVAGTTGAGDAAIAGFLAGLLRDLPPEEALTAAVAVGACNVETADAVSGVRPWDEMWQRVTSGWGRCTLSIDAPGWRFGKHRQMWAGPAELAIGTREIW
jgi:sugar/nucleoside kinase (ribokinase family)